jgi:hypothetical protein
MKAAVVAIAALLAASSALPPAWAKTERSAETRRQFQHEHPCPSTGKTTGACPGYVKDHVTPLCKGGPDKPGNMQWQTVAEGRAKDRWECK